MGEFDGIYPAIVTPFDDDENLDLDGFRAVAEHVYDQGVHGLYICGSTGEGIMMTVEERKRVAECAVEVSKGRGKVIAHVGCVAARDTCELARHAEKAGVDAISSVPPIYFPCTPAEVKAYYADISASCGLPLFVYYIPSLIKFELTPEFLAELLEIKTVKGMKFTSPDHYMLNRFAMMTEGRDFTIYNGADQQLISGLSLGARGGIGSTYNYQPKWILGIYNSFKEGNWEAARQFQYKANKQVEILQRFPTLPYTKAMLGLQGLPAGRCRRPLCKLDEAQLARARKMLDEVGWPE